MNAAYMWTLCAEGGTMSVVTIAEAWPAAGRPFTVAELDRMPDDGRRYELLGARREPQADDNSSGRRDASAPRPRRRLP